MGWLEDVFLILLTISYLSGSFKLPSVLIHKHTFIQTLSNNEINPKTEFMLPETKHETFASFFAPGQDIPLLCELIGIASVGQKEYGIGFPVHSPVELIYIENKKLHRINSDFPNYLQLLEYIDSQLGQYELNLQPTPMFLTLAGDLEEEGEDSTNILNRKEDDDAEEVEIEDLLNDESMEDIEDIEDDAEDESYEDQYDDDEYEEEYESESQMNKKKRALSANQHAVAPETDQPQVPKEFSSSLITDDDLQKMEKESKFVDRIFRYATDAKYLGTFPFEKKNIHLIKLLQPQIIFGTRLLDRKGYLFELLNEREMETVAPKLSLLLEEYLEKNVGRDIDKNTNQTSALGDANATYRRLSSLGRKPSISFPWSSSAGNLNSEPVTKSTSRFSAEPRKSPRKSDNQQQKSSSNMRNNRGASFNARKKDSFSNPQIEDQRKESENLRKSKRSWMNRSE